jgi:hypothetical protein
VSVTLLNVAGWEDVRQDQEPGRHPSWDSHSVCPEEGPVQGRTCQRSGKRLFFISFAHLIFRLRFLSYVGKYRHEIFTFTFVSTVLKD